MKRILVLDDDHAIRETAALALEKSGFRALRAATVDEARTMLDGGGIDLVLSDIYLEEGTALSLFDDIRRRDSLTPVILMTARGSVETASFAARAGAFDYIAKPFDVDHLVARVRAAVEPAIGTPQQLEPQPDTMIVGSHPSMVEVYKSVARIARLNVPVLILGETGTGKELVARALHSLGAAPGAAFVAVNCGAIPDTLLESELFGYVRGAFTDARRDRKGAMQRASGGSVFLDEIGDISPAFQVKILRFLQDRVITPLGSDRSERVEVRVIAATNRELSSMVAAGTFRQDLYFRLASYEIRVPPLRERLSDIPLLVDHFRGRVAREIGIDPPPPASAQVVEILAGYDWPGNVRELEQVVRRMLIDGGSITDPALARKGVGEIGAAATVRRDDIVRYELPQSAGAPLTTLEEAERRHILAVLEATGGNRTQAAHILGIERKTLSRKLKRFGAASGAEDEETENQP
jgi:DNA-binding NtrC family response regulator